MSPKLAVIYPPLLPWRKRVPLGLSQAIVERPSAGALGERYDPRRLPVSKDCSPRTPYGFYGLGGFDHRKHPRDRRVPVVPGAQLVDAYERILDKALIYGSNASIGHAAE